MSTDTFKDDLNITALHELINLVKQNADLLPEWKQTFLRLLESDGIPLDLESLQELIAGDKNVTTANS